ncbi:MAG: universal stress protein [Gammaproteobacteria bacterium]|nr:universal stress protein [Gammaproteobacteria bacterium]
MFGHILVAVDGSATSDLALQQAIRLAKEQRSELRVVHVVDEVSLNWPEGGDFAEVQETFRKSGRKILEKADAEMRKAAMTAETKLLEIETFGHRVADMIAAEAEAWPADLIVIGTHGRRGVRRLLLGSVAEGVARLASKPVLLIRGG